MSAVPAVTPMGGRSAARLAAVQALYQIELSAAPYDMVVAEFLKHRLGREIDGVSYGPADVKLFAEIVAGCVTRRDEIDGLINARLSKDRRLERLEAILRALLRAATYELLARPDVPARTAINEYLDIAHAFFGGPEPGFVNGVLDGVAHDLRATEFENASHGHNGPRR
ncbi:MAG TPA: transcription antitermination factor NusB [Candidatus Cybelea sp.]|nr:transcription antitermination factor NusB [Candidatus Cybelea sp.]